MYIAELRKKSKSGKVYVSYVIMESYRDKETKKVKHRVIANISKLPPYAISALKEILKGRGVISLSDIKFEQTKSVGILLVFTKLMKELGIEGALGKTKEAKLVKLMILSRIAAQGSKLFAKRWSVSQAIEEVLGIDFEFNENDLYKAMDWLLKRKEKIEKKLYKQRVKRNGVSKFYLYDITSSYFEGEKNELAEYGYNRDKVKGKKQIVIALGCDEEGMPITVEVFKGNMNDSKTVEGHVRELERKFGMNEVVFVGDKGMLNSKNISALRDNWHYITSISRETIRKLLKEGVFQYELFSEDLAEIEYDGIRYVLKKNPFRARESREKREKFLGIVKDYISEQNEYLREHPRAKEEVALRHVEEEISKFNLKKFISIHIEGREIKYEINEEKLKEEEALDGCYVLKTDLKSAVADKKEVHERYKDLQRVERAFETMKRGLLEVRPIYHVRADRTKSHVFLVMLSYMLVKEFNDRTKHIEATLDEKLLKLKDLHLILMKLEDFDLIKRLPDKLDKETHQLLKAAGINPERVKFN